MPRTPEEKARQMRALRARQRARQAPDGLEVQPASKTRGRGQPASANGMSAADQRAREASRAAAIARKARDTRPQMAPETVGAGLAAAAAALSPVLDPSARRWPAVEVYAPMRRQFHSLPDAERRALIARLLLEEAERIAHDLGASWGAR